MPYDLSLALGIRGKCGWVVRSYNQIDLLYILTAIQKEITSSEEKWRQLVPAKENGYTTYNTHKLNHRHYIHYVAAN